MKLLIGDASYEVTESLDYATLGALDDLQSATKTSDFNGITVRWIREQFQLASEEGAVDPRDSLDYRRALTGLVFLARRRAGEDITYEQARETNAKELGFLISDAEVEELPKSDAATAADQPI